MYQYVGYMFVSLLLFLFVFCFRFSASSSDSESDDQNVIRSSISGQIIKKYIKVKQTRQKHISTCPNIYYTQLLDWGIYYYFFYVFFFFSLFWCCPVRLFRLLMLTSVSCHSNISICSCYVVVCLTCLFPTEN
jgi:hypothetical protein